MARRNVPKTGHAEPIANLVAVESDDWKTKATGTKENLIQAGLCVPAHFPDGRKRSLYSKEYSLTKKDSIWTLTIWTSQDEREQRKQARLEREARERRLRLTAKTAAEWREKKSFSLSLAMAAIDQCTENDGGFHMQEKDIALIRALSKRLAMVVNNAQVQAEPNLVRAEEGSTLAQPPVARLRAPLRLVSA